MQDATIVKLQPGHNIDSVMTFEEAFGEHSNLFGKGRARRAKRKAQRQANRQKKRMTRIQNRGQRQAARRANRAAKHGGSDDSSQDDQLQPLDQTAGTAADTSTDAASNDTASAAPQDNSGAQASDGSVPQDSAPIERDNAEDANGDISDPYAAQDDGSDDSAGGDADDAGIDGYQDSFDAAMSSFTGDVHDLSANNFFEFEGQDGQKVRERIHPKVRETARKVEWNKEMVQRLESKLPQDSNLIDEQDEAISELINKITDHKSRAMDLEDKLSFYIDDSSADGIHRKRSSEVNAATREARKQRMGVHMSSKQANKMKGKDLTEIEQGLDPETTPSQITIPAQSNLVDEHSYNNLIDEHSYNNLVSEHDYGFDGKKFVTDHKKGIVIGAAVGVALIVAITLLTKKKSA